MAGETTIANHAWRTQPDGRIQCSACLQLIQEAAGTECHMAAPITITFVGAGPCPKCGGAATGCCQVPTPAIAHTASGTWIPPGERTVYHCASGHQWSPPAASPPPAAPGPGTGEEGCAHCGRLRHQHPRHPACRVWQSPLATDSRAPAPGWSCPQCGRANDREPTRCPCGWERSLESCNRARVAAERALEKAEAERDEALASSGLWSERTQELLASLAAAESRERALRDGVRRLAEEWEREVEAGRKTSRRQGGTAWNHRTSGGSRCAIVERCLGELRAALGDEGNDASRSRALGEGR